jgi:hypothetical protein
MNIELFEQLCIQKMNEYLEIAAAYTPSSHTQQGDDAQYFHDLTAKMMLELRQHVAEFVREEGMKEDHLVAIVQKHFGRYFQEITKLSVAAFSKPHQ